MSHSCFSAQVMQLVQCHVFCLVLRFCTRYDQQWPFAIYCVVEKNIHSFNMFLKLDTYAIPPLLSDFHLPSNRTRFLHSNHNWHARINHSFSSLSLSFPLFLWNWAFFQTETCPLIVSSHSVHISSLSIQQSLFPIQIGRAHASFSNTKINSIELRFSLLFHMLTRLHFSNVISNDFPLVFIFSSSLFTARFTFTICSNLITKLSRQ